MARNNGSRRRKTPGQLRPPPVAAEYLDEPSLQFGGGREHVDPKMGITLFGPQSVDRPQRHPDSIKVGFIGSGRSIGSARDWISSCLWGVEGDENNLRFPGFSEECGFFSNIQYGDDWIETISQHEFDSLKNTRFYKDKFPLALEIVVEKVRLLSRKDRPPDIVLLALPDELLKHCQTVDYVDPALGTVHRDFRRALKAEIMKYQMPTQILLQRTTEAEPNSRQVDHKSKCAWNFFTGFYFKAGGVPWTPLSLRPGTCYVGVSFYKPIGSALSSNTQVSLAQAFDEHGEGLVLRGPEFAWDAQEHGRAPHLSTEQASELLTRVLTQYEDWMGQKPSRVVVHKSSRFWDNEREGFVAILKQKDVPHYDFVSVHNTSELRLLRAGKYPVLRGTHFALGEIHFLYTTGFIPAQNAYPHGHIPSPLQVADHIGDSGIRDVLKEILALTKMNWNSANFAISKPITLRFSQLVGDILKEIPADREPLPQYKFYI